MSDFSDLILTHSPQVYLRLNETAGATAADSSGNARDASLVGSPSLNQPGATSDNDPAITVGTTDYVSIPSYSAFDGLSAVTVLVWVKAATQSTNRYLWTRNISTSDYAYLYLNTSNQLVFRVKASSSGALTGTITSAAVDLSDWSLVAITHDAGRQDLWVDGVNVGLNNSGADWPSGVKDIWFGHNTLSTDGGLDEIAIIPSALTQPQLEAIYNASLGPAASGLTTLPMRLYSHLVSGASNLPMRLGTPVVAPVATLPMRLESIDPVDYAGPVVRWGVLVTLDGADISAQLTSDPDIEHEENASGLCSLTFIPASGAIDPADFERKPLQVSILLRDASGATVSTARLYTGVTSSASYDPDADLMSVDATTDLAGWLENADLSVIDAQIGGLWSSHVFEESADGYQYALDRLSTTPAEMHVDNYGRFEVVQWAAKATQDVTLTDAGRFDDTLRLVRANRRDLITRVRINLDFRFHRLRHREINANFVDTLGLCSHLDYNWQLPAKDMLRSVFDSTEWTRISEIKFVDLPSTPQANICSGKNWNPGGNNEAADFCLGGSCRMARRWAQIVTEENALDVIATDLEQAIGQQQINADYGVEATYDAGDFEQISSFDAAPGGAVLSPVSDDWQKDATDAEYDGRLAMQAAQECALAWARVKILGRARGNRLTLSPVFRPDITLASTVRVNTPGLVAKGKVARVSYRLGIDGGAPDMEIELALSRHGGSGLAVDDPLTPAPTPTQPAETPTPRTHYFGFRLGGLTASPPDDEDWEGYMCNPQESLRDAGAPVYRERLQLHMPEIEEPARNAVSVAQAVDYTVAVPEDELTMSS